MKTYRNILTILALLLLSINIYSQELNILTEDDPPYSFTKDGKPTGFAVEIINEIQSRLKINNEIKIYPWARAIRMATDDPNTIIFTLSRTKEREKLFQWVGPIVENDWILVGDSNSSLNIQSLEDAKKIKNIGTVRDYAWTNYLKAQGFTNLDEVTSRKVNSMKLKIQRIEAFVSSDTGFKEEIIANEIPISEFKVLYTIASIQMYIGFSKKTDKKIVDTWQSTFEEMKKDGTFNKLHQKWLKNAKIPGAAKPGDI